MQPFFFYECILYTASTAHVWESNNVLVKSSWKDPKRLRFSLSKHNRGRYHVTLSSTRYFRLLSNNVIGNRGSLPSNAVPVGLVTPVCELNLCAVNEVQFFSRLANDKTTSKKHASVSAAPTSDFTTSSFSFPSDTLGDCTR